MRKDIILIDEPELVLATMDYKLSNADREKCDGFSLDEIPKDVTFWNGTRQIMNPERHLYVRSFYDPTRYYTVESMTAELQCEEQKKVIKKFAHLLGATSFSWYDEYNKLQTEDASQSFGGKTDKSKSIKARAKVPVNGLPNSADGEYSNKSSGNGALERETNKVDYQKIQIHEGFEGIVAHQFSTEDYNKAKEEYEKLGYQIPEVETLFDIRNPENSAVQKIYSWEFRKEDYSSYKSRLSISASAVVESVMSLCLGVGPIGVSGGLSKMFNLQLNCEFIKETSIKEVKNTKLNIYFDGYKPER